MFWSKSFTRPSQASQKQHSKQLSLHLEHLEERMLMNADNNPAPLLTSNLDSATPVVLPVSRPIIADDSMLSVGFPIGQVKSYISPIDYTSSINIPRTDISFQSIEEIRNWITQFADEHFTDKFGTTYNKPTFRSYPIWCCDTIDFDITNLDPIILRSSFLTNQIASMDFSSDQSAADFSGTNVQVEGVDEADLIETDGDYLYLITGGELIIVDTTDETKPSIASRVRLHDRPSGMYLTGDRLTLISSGRNTTVTVLDLSDRTAPTQVQKTELDGRLVSSRMVDGQLRVVLQSYNRSFPRYLPGIQGHLVSSNDSNEATYQYETRAEYLNRVVDSMIDNLLPGYRSLSVDNQVLNKEWLTSFEETFAANNRHKTSRMTIATFDAMSNAAGPADIKTVFSDSPNEIYATENSLYVFGRDYDRHHGSKTAIWKFDFNNEDHSISLAAKGKVEGRLLNQFAADEHDGYLRVVMTDVPTPGVRWGRSQSLFVLKQFGNELRVVSSVDGLAPRERLHSVRFMGDRAFAVTFRKVDPLFAIDLSDPMNPEVAGELKIPGYSDYLQPLDENHLLGIGRGANERSGLFQELQVSIFDVSDLGNPELAHRYSFEGGRSTASIATGGRWSRGDGDHHAVSYLPSAEILAIPIHSENWFRFGSDNTPRGLQIFQIDVDTGFTPLALIEHDSQILRSLRLEESLIVASAGTVTVHNLVDPSIQLHELDLQVGSNYQLVDLTAFGAIDTLTPSQAAAFSMHSDTFQTAEHAMRPLLSQALSFSEEASGLTVDPFHEYALGQSTKTAATDLAWQEITAEDEAPLQFGADDSLAIDLALFLGA